MMLMLQLQLASLNLTKKVDQCIQKSKTMEVTLGYLLLNVCFMFIGFSCHGL